MQIRSSRPDCSVPRRSLTVEPAAGAVPAMVVDQFNRLAVDERARILGRLLSSVGPLALAVVGEGAFAKYVRHSRLPQVPVSSDDAARATPSQVSDLLRYVQQSDPQLVRCLLETGDAVAAH